MPVTWIEQRTMDGLGLTDGSSRIIPGPPRQSAGLEAAKPAAKYDERWGEGGLLTPDRFAALVFSALA